MNYFVKRGDKEYGPYTLAALQQYVTQGNISQQDLGRSEGMTDWAPVSTLLGNVTVATTATFGAGSSAALIPDRPLPPNLHWAIVLVLGIVTVGIFWIIWLFVEAAWVRKVRPQSQALYYLIAYLACTFSIVGFGKSPVTSLLQIGGFILYLVGIFKMRSDIEEYYATINPVGLSLSGVVTFFFNALYFQYHFSEMRKTAQETSMSVAAGS